VYVLTIVAGRTSPPHCSLSGECLSTAHAHQVCLLGLVARDAFGNRQKSGGDSLSAHLQGPLLSPKDGTQEAGQEHTGATHAVTTHDKLDGSYAVAFLVGVVGRYTLAVSISEVDVRGSPFAVEVQGGFHFRTISSEVPRFAHANSSFLLLGDAQVRAGGLHLSAVPPRANSVGGAWFRIPQRMTSGFILDFELQISAQAPRVAQGATCHPAAVSDAAGLGDNAGAAPVGWEDEWCRRRAGDGAALVLARAPAGDGQWGGGAGGESREWVVDDASARRRVPGLGDGGAGLGYEGLRSTLALEFDVVENRQLGDLERGRF